MSIVERVLAVLAPHDCLQCGREGSLLCSDCRAVVAAGLQPRCYRCQALSTGSRICRSCRSSSRLRAVWACLAYDGPARQLVYALKFNHAREAANVMADMLAASLPALPPDTIVTHVPTAPHRMRGRGFDQAALLARELARRAERPAVPLLARTSPVRQTGAKRRLRHSQMAGAFRPVNGTLITGAHVLLVDDVLTTGATLEAAADCLRTAGARHVDAAVFAQAMRM